MNKGSFISKKESVVLQAIAVMLMVFHHLFAFPERVSSPYTYIFDFSFLHIETMLAYFGRICIGMFAFISGYGMCKVAYRKIYDKEHQIFCGYKLIFFQLLKFYRKFWIVCIVFIPLGFFFDVYQVDWVIILKSFLGISTAYNGEWWYIVDYVRFLILFPIVFYLFSLLHHFPKVIRMVVIVLTVVGILFGYIFFPYLTKYSVALSFLFGMITLESNLYENAYDYLIKAKSFRYLVAFVGILSVAILRIVAGLNCDYDFVLVPIFVFFLMVFIKGTVFVKFLNYGLLYIGKYSTYIWLTHTFFAYYYFQVFTYFPRISILIFIWCLTLSVFTGVVLDKVLSVIEKGLNRITRKKDNEKNPT